MSELDKRLVSVMPSPRQLALQRMEMYAFWHFSVNTFTGREWGDGTESPAVFNPARFDPRQWAKAVKAAGMTGAILTCKHHDGFCLWPSAYTEHSVKNSPCKKDIVKEAADACRRAGLKFGFYLSPWDRHEASYGTDAYNDYYCNQLTELLTNYGPIGAIWFDGYWDHKDDKVPFDWQLPEQYALIHKLQPSCLVANNHHVTPHPGEDIQIFERDLPGQNLHGLSGQEVSRLPLETCTTMNGMWGYKILDQNYKPTPELIELLVNARGKGANLLLNIGPQPNGELPAASLTRLKEIGEWMKVNGETIYGVTAGDFPEQSWGTSTRKGDKLYVHVFRPEGNELVIPVTGKVKKAVGFADKQPLKFKKIKEGGISLTLPKIPEGTIDYIIELETASK